MSLLFLQAALILLVIDLAFLYFLTISFNMCLLLALSCTKFDDVVRDKCGLKYILLAKRTYVVFY